ncbi:MAG: universal stress protein, partial [Armatimonadota bacterium]|nr:universal stress protein [Armatimonadota bacterium]
VVLVPVSPPFSGAAAQSLLRRLNLGAGAEIHFAYAMVIPRSLPVGAPLPEEEARAEASLAAAELAIPAGVKSRHVLRARNMPEAITSAITRLGAAEVIAGMDPNYLGDESVTAMINTLRSRCPCPLTITQDHAPTPAA